MRIDLGDLLPVGRLPGLDAFGSAQVKALRFRAVKAGC